MIFCYCQVYDHAAIAMYIMMYMNQEYFFLFCECTKQAGDQIVACIDWLIVHPWHFVYFSLWEACLLFSIYNRFISHWCQCSSLTCLADTMGVFFCSCRVSLMCRVVQINPSGEEFWPLPQPVSPPSSTQSPSCSGRRTTTSCHRVTLPSAKQWSHSSYQESPDCLKYLPLCLI